MYKISSSTIMIVKTKTMSHVTNQTKCAIHTNATRWLESALSNTVSNTIAVRVLIFQTLKRKLLRRKRKRKKIEKREMLRQELQLLSRKKTFLQLLVIKTRSGAIQGSYVQMLAWLESALWNNTVSNITAVTTTRLVVDM